MQDGSMQYFWDTAHISGSNAAYVEELYELYLSDPGIIPEQWRIYFETLPKVEGVDVGDVPHSVIRKHFLSVGQNKFRAQSLAPVATDSIQNEKQWHVVELVRAYRQFGHMKAHLDPLALHPQPNVSALNLEYHKLSRADLDVSFRCQGFLADGEQATLSDILQAMEATYCGSIGADFMHIADVEQQRWVQHRLESSRSQAHLNQSAKQHLLKQLIAAEGLEKYLATRYPGTKRFGLEGGESLIPVMDELIQRAGSYQAQEVVLGMAHRGRLNILVNILGKNPSDLFAEFEGKQLSEKGSGDVKYHQGFSSNVMTSGGEIHLAMAFNPSHLEIVSPVVQGSVRSRQDRRQDTEHTKVVPICIHGDAAFSGQGVVLETFQMSQTRAYKTGGTLHIVVNNQVGFTTSKREDARSTQYCSDVAKMVDAPIFHVNGDDPEAVILVTRLAMDFRMTFKKDVVIDLVCYRRRGHNEADEPSSTQPMMYQKIQKHKPVRELYAQQLIEQGILSEKQSKAWLEDYRNVLDKQEHVVQSLVREPDASLFVDWTPYLGHQWTAKHDTRVNLQTLQTIAKQMLNVPEGIVLQRQVQKIYEDRRKMTAGSLPINWGFGETLAYATLVKEGHPIRITGQDVGRGTFSHRHVVLHNQKDGETFIPLQHMAEDQPRFEIYDSLLSEEAVLAFEYGYATTNPKALIVWEAQFGDFANGAQVVIDQFITSGENKWGRLCGLTLLLPHGYEGQGPEHSSARLERFLQLSAEQNIQVCVPSTPAQVFHMLRRQVLRPVRKPLIVFSPKSLLRHKAAVSTLEDLADGAFHTVLDDTMDKDPAEIKRVILCSGKVYYDLIQHRSEHSIDDTAVVRIEQLFPFPQEDLQPILARYKQLKAVVWCQEEPLNQGAWYSSQHHIRRAIEHHNRALHLTYAGREASAAPACGYMSVHVAQQKQLVEDAFSA